jgi:hypothetical protein
MPFIGNKPAQVPLTSADIADSIITSAKIVDGTITNSDVASSIITGQTAETSIAGGDSILIYDDSATALRKMTRTNFVAGVGGANTPAFYAYNSTATSIGSGVNSKIDFQTEVLDSDNCFASSRFTPTTAGYYYFTCQVHLSATVNTNHALYLNRNGSVYTTFWDISLNINGLTGSCMAYANGTTDYFETAYYQSSGTSRNTTTGQLDTFFSGFRIIGA